MPTPISVTEAIVLKSTASGEKFEQIYMLSPDLGLIRTMVRKKSGTVSSKVDLFDQGEARIEIKQGDHSGFLKDFDLQKKRTGIGAGYETLASACEFSNLIIRNPVHEDNAVQVFSLVERTLDAFEKNQHPHAILLKAMYLYCRDEGYPVLEDWAEKIDRETRKTVVHILNTPTEKIESDKGDQIHALDALKSYIQTETHIHFT